MDPIKANFQIIGINTVLGKCELLIKPPQGGFLLPKIWRMKCLNL